MGVESSSSTGLIVQQNSTADQSIQLVNAVPVRFNEPVAVLPDATQLEGPTISTRQGLGDRHGTKAVAEADVHLRGRTGVVAGDGRCTLPGAVGRHEPGDRQTREI